MFLEILQNSPENTYDRVFFLIELQAQASSGFFCIYEKLNSFSIWIFVMLSWKNMIQPKAD